MSRPRGVHLLAYADRLGGSLSGLCRLLAEPPLSVFSGVHVLPFFVPYDGPDAGFDPVDHSAVDPRLGTWDDVAALARAGLDVTADLVVNHVSAESAEFRDWLARGAASPHDGMFLTFDGVFPDGAREADITAFYRPRPGVPFTPYRLADGRRRLVWTTFLPTQVDLDLRHPVARAYLTRLLRLLVRHGVGTVRLDAVGYAIKTPGTDSFLTDDTLDFIRDITRGARSEGLRVLVEVHAHHTQQMAIAPLVDLVYDFALPPLLLHSLGTGTVDRLDRWLAIRPVNAVTVLDTHDGIGVVDAGPGSAGPGLLDDDEMAAVFQRAAEATRGESERASTAVAWTVLPHQVNSTFYSVLAEDDTRYVIARAVQLLVPGEPQVYYVGLLAGSNDVERFERTRVGREINRHAYTADEVEHALGRDVVRAQLALVSLRSAHPAFEGRFEHRVLSSSRLELAWRHGPHAVVLDVDVDQPSFRLSTTAADGVRTFTSVADLAAAAPATADAERDAS